MELLQGFESLVSSWQGLGEIPSLVIGARGDVIVRPSAVREMAELAGPASRYEEIEGSHLEAPARAKGQIAAWLDELSA